VLMVKGEIIERWTEYIQELFEDDRENMPPIRKDIDGPEILKDEVRFAIKNMKRNNAYGPDNIFGEYLQATEEFSVEKITEIANDIYNSGRIQEDLTKSIFILRNVCKRAIEVNKDLYLCFIDFNKAFDKVRHNKLLNMLQDLDMDGKDIRFVRNLYWEQSAAIRHQNELGNFASIKRGVRQGCVLSPDLFNLYSENIMRHLDGIGGLIVGGYTLNNLRYADDIVLIAQSKEKLREMLDIIDFYSEENGLSINLKKTECMVVSKYKNVMDSEITIKGNPIKQVENFKL